MNNKTFKKVETIEEFREILLKLFVSEKSTKGIYLKPTLLSDLYDEYGERMLFYPVEKIKTFRDFIQLDCFVYPKNEKNDKELIGFMTSNFKIVKKLREVCETDFMKLK